MPEIGIVITARMDSKRLPGKALMPLAGRPMIGYLFDRLNSLSNIPKILATTPLPSDDNLIHWAHAYDIKTYRGSSVDVLHRIYSTAQQFELKNIIRITGDDCFTDIPALKVMIQEHLKNKNDLTENPTVPKGMETRIYSFQLLEKVFKKHREYDTELMDTWFHELAEKKQIIKTPNYSDLSVSLSIDTMEDYRRIRKTFYDCQFNITGRTLHGLYYSHFSGSSNNR